MLTISPTHSVLLREGAPGVVAWDPNQQGKRAIVIAFILYLNIEVMGRWQTRFKEN
jgi:hypothetical protein